MKKDVLHFVLSLILLSCSRSTEAFQPLSHRRRHVTPYLSSSRKNRFSFQKEYGIVPHHFSMTRLRNTATDQFPNHNSTLIETTNDVKNPTSNNTISSNYPPTPTFRECLAFALPALGIYLCPPLMSLIDASFIGRLSTSLELAALGPASTISDSAPLPLLFLSIAATNLIAKSFSQKDHEASARVSRTAIGLGTICGSILAGLLAIFSRHISALYCGGEPTLVTACTKYVAIRAIALPAVVITTIAQAICIGTKDTRTSMISVALAGVCNFLGDLILVKGFKQGIAGAAWATSFSQIVAAGLLLRVLKKRGFLKMEQDQDQNQNQNNSTIDTIKQLLSFIPFLFIMTVKIGWHNSCTATAASLGGVQAAAHTALLSVAMVCMVLGDVGSSLSQAFLPAFEGSKAPTTTISSNDNNSDKGLSSRSVSSYFDLEAAMPTIRQLLKCTLSISATVAMFAATMIGIFGGQISSDPAVVVEMRKTLPWILATLSFHGSAVTLEGLLLSCKMFRPLSVCYTILAITVAGFQIATRRFGLGLAGVWGCYLWFCASRVITFSSLGGLLRPRQWLQKIGRIRKLQSQPKAAF